MKVFEKGHIYQPQIRTPDGQLTDETREISFVNRQAGQEHNGTHHAGSDTRSPRSHAPLRQLHAASEQRADNISPLHGASSPRSARFGTQD
jgi:hypothetical protein